MSVMALGNYQLAYPPGQVVSADAETLGITVFRTLENARKFIWNSLRPGKHLYLIVKVKPIGRGKRVRLVSLFRNSKSLTDFYAGRWVEKCPPPEGTLCYKAVEVLS